MPSHVTCPRCGCAARVGAHHSAYCVQCFTSFRTDVDHHPDRSDSPMWHAPREHFHPCSRCGQTVITRADPPVCQTCRRLERRSQGETVRLFEPAPNQMPGQLAL
jgi:predicted RNA-binding Zn-ribbon protein involved in translation (DUF1610 family)